MKVLFRDLTEKDVVQLWTSNDVTFGAKTMSGKIKVSGGHVSAQCTTHRKHIAKMGDLDLQFLVSNELDHVLQLPLFVADLHSRDWFGDRDKLVINAALFEHGCCRCVKVHCRT